MPNGTRICKVCGKEYEYCHTVRPSGVFRYQDVACCPEHGATYLREVQIARGEITEEPKKQTKKNVKFEKAKLADKPTDENV